MFKPQKMAKLKILCSKDSLKQVIEELYKSKAVDIIDHSRDEKFDIGTPFSESAELSEAIILSRTSLSQLGIKPTEDIKPLEIDVNNPKEINDIVISVKELHSKITKLISEQREAVAGLKLLEETREKVESLNAVHVTSEMLVKSENLIYFLGHVENQKKLALELKETVGGSYELYPNAEQKVIALFVDKRKEMQAIKVLQQNNFSEMKLAEEFIGKKLTVKDILDEIAKLKKQEEEAGKMLISLKEKWIERLPAIEKTLRIIIRKAEAPLKFGETKNISIISGWVPEKTKAHLIKKLNEVTTGKINIDELEISEHDSVPIKLDNPKLVSPYELLLKLYSMPSYHEINPLMFMYFTFPLFFGFMLGDIGYGIVLLIIFLTIMKIKPEFKQFMTILCYSAVSSIIFGILYGEVFGLEHIGHYELWHVISRLHSINELLIASLVIGVLHINFGLLLGFINEMQHGFKRAVLEKGSWFLIEAAVAILVLSYMKMIILMPIVGWVLLIIAVVMLYLGEGARGIIELPTIFSHTLSYARLMALGVASAGLAMVINEQAAPLFHMGIFGIIGGILILIFGHGLNMALGVIGPFLHSLRLHYVEHFTKYYKGGGKDFKAFGAED